MTIADCLIEQQAIGQKNHHDDTMVNWLDQTLAKPQAIYNNGLSFPVLWEQAS